MKEVFKDITGYEGLYQLSNLDRVKGLCRSVKHSTGDGYYVKKERILKGHITKEGYVRYFLHKKGKGKGECLHVLKMIVYKGFIPGGYKLVVDHIDNDPANNDLDNLQVITHRENCSKDRFGCSSKYVGVTYLKTTNKWRATILIDGEVNYLGQYKEEIEAYLAYQKKLNSLKK